MNHFIYVFCIQQSVNFCFLQSVNSNINCVYSCHHDFMFQCAQSELDSETVKSILSEYKIHNADITLRSDATADDLIDVVEGNRQDHIHILHLQAFSLQKRFLTWLFFLSSRVYLPCIYVLNKIDQISIEELDVIYKIPHCVPISAHHRWNFDDLLERIWDYLQLVRM